MRQIQSPNYGGTRGQVYWVIVHTAEGALTVDQLGNYFANPASQVSSHVGIDDHETVQYVDYSQVAWTARSANPYADQAELCAFAAWTRADWLAHTDTMLENTAQWIADRCKARGIPPTKIGPSDVAARRPGVIGHVDITNGLHDGTHQDPGTSFPWDVVMARVNAILSPQEDDMTPAQAQQLQDLHDRLAKFDLAAWAILGGNGQSGIRDLLGSVLAQEAKQADPSALAAALAPLLAGALQGQGALTETDLETALRNVLGSLDNHS